MVDIENEGAIDAEKLAPVFLEIIRHNAEIPEFPLTNENMKQKISEFIAMIKPKAAHNSSPHSKPTKAPELEEFRE